MLRTRPQRNPRQRAGRAVALGLALAACGATSATSWWRRPYGGGGGGGRSGGAAASYFGGSSPPMPAAGGGGLSAASAAAASRQGPTQQTAAGVEASGSASSPRVAMQAQQQGAAVSSEEDGLVQINTREEFEANLDAPVTVAMFSSPMCGPCVLVEPKIVEMQAEFKSAGLKVIKLNLTPGKNVKELRPLFSDLEVKALPTFLVYKAGEVRGRLSGTKHEELREMIQGLI